MKSLEEGYERYREVVERVGYLKEVNEAMIYESYKEKVMEDQERSFGEEMSEENRDLYYRMKFRVIR